MATDIQLTPTANMPPVETTSTGTSSTTGNSGIAPSPEAQAAAETEARALEGQAAAQRRVGAEVAVAEGAKADQLDAEAGAYNAAAVEAQAVRDAYTARIKAAQTAADQAEKQYENHQFHNFWDNKSTGQYITAKLAAAFGGFGAALVGGPNQALQNINAAIDRDFEAQKAALVSKENLAKWRREGVSDLYGQMQKELAGLEVKQSLAHKAVALKAQAEAQRKGIPLEQAKNDVVVAGQDAAAAAKRTEATQRYEQHYDRQQQKNASTQVTTAKAGQGGGVEADKNAANFAVLKDHGNWIAGEMSKLTPDDIAAVQRAMSSEEFLGGGKIAAALASVGIDAESGLSQRAKEYLDKARSAAEALGRVQSGAAIGTEEGRRFMQSLMPKVSDTPETIQKRAERLRADIQSRGQYMERPPRTGQADPKAALRAKALEASTWLKQHPNDPNAVSVRRGLARLNQQIGAQ